MNGCIVPHFRPARKQLQNVTAKGICWLRQRYMFACANVICACGTLYAAVAALYVGCANVICPRVARTLRMRCFGANTPKSLLDFSGTPTAPFDYFVRGSHCSDYAIHLTTASRRSRLKRSFLFTPKKTLFFQGPRFALWLRTPHCGVSLTRRAPEGESCFICGPLRSAGRGKNLKDHR